ncbi:class I mannose-6-phosphate isomerase [Flavimaricola marinus]|uniref:Putative mannose-6-phosphate isomerase YvyI n=1 Tax=Flavimaricola marinus TaxID=1819565 RepID=A0A238LJI4_9RHOB|nr:class I mannose-6-phosphate isomerase [Flavimaricola marinus]SMY09772.1 Putative mannose-6-phosphate isomerase YvyI [Flavimaricola marinus]
MTYDVRPEITVSGTAFAGWQAIRTTPIVTDNPSLRIECYPGVDVTGVLDAFDPGHEKLHVDTHDLRLPPNERADLLSPFLTDDRVFGTFAPPDTAPLEIADFLDDVLVSSVRDCINTHVRDGGSVLIAGPGAAYVATGTELDAAPLIYADMPRWEIQTRLRAGRGTWLAPEPFDDMLRAFKLGYFVEWRSADRCKMALFDDVDLFLDTTDPENPLATTGEDMRRALGAVVQRPFRTVPFFDPGVWGGQWMKREFDLPDGPDNYAWGFDCVPEENSLLLAFDGGTLEVPAINVVLRHPEDLLGKPVFQRFGAEFPIRFDFLDTIEGGNLSLQVHPDADYARDRFGLSYTQDESYYILAAEPDAHVYLGLTDGTSPQHFFDALHEAQEGGGDLDVARYVNRLPTARHDHFSIPSGTIHCAGRGCMVLEISATPYIFTFKLWDWGRLGLDGRPRPIHAEHGQNVLKGDRDRTWVDAEILEQSEILVRDGTYVEERTGLHASEFIETRRHWFDSEVQQETGDSVHVLNLVQGDGAIIESPTAAFKPFVVGFAETFIIPATVGAYTFRPVTPGQACGMINAAVRT